MDRVLSFIKTIFKNISTLGVVLLLLAGPLAPDGKPWSTAGTVTATRLNVRTRPERSAPATATLSKGTRVLIVEEYEKWLKIEIQGQSGFVSRRFVQPVVSPSPLPPGTSQQTITQESRQLQSQLSEKQKEAASFWKKEAEIIDALDQIDTRLNHSEKQVALLRKKLADLADEIKLNKDAVQKTAQEVDQLEIHASRRLASLYKLSQLGTTSLMASADSLFDLLGRKKKLQELLAHDESIWQSLAQKKARYEHLTQTRHRQRQAHLLQAAELEEKIQSLAQRRAVRSALLSEVQSKKSLTLAAIAALKQAAAALDHEIETISPPPAPQPAPAPAEQAFHKFKGLLNMPVSGTIISFFGPYKSPQLNVTGYRSGIDILADRGEPIRAVKGGSALYAGWFKGYGNMVILDHGQHYCTVYAHAQEIFKKKGEPVEPGEVIATVGDTGSIEGPKLHFEIRHHGKPVDPLKWIGKRSKNKHD